MSEPPAGIDPLGLAIVILAVLALSSLSFRSRSNVAIDGMVQLGRTTITWEAKSGISIERGPLEVTY